MSEQFEPDMLNLLFVSSVGSHGCAITWQDNQLFCLDSTHPYLVNLIFWHRRESEQSNADIWRKILQPKSDPLQPEGNTFFEALSHTIQKELLKFSPSDEDWQQFWDALDNTKVWSWESRYQFPDDISYHDGYWWVVEIKRGEQELKSEGFIVYPDSFPVFCKAVSQLIGGRHFYFADDETSLGF